MIQNDNKIKNPVSLLTGGDDICGNKMDCAGIIHDVLGDLIPRGAPVALLDYPNYPNVGDSAIWLGEEAYLNSKNENKIIRVDECSLDGDLPALPEDVLVLINGGGNFGDLWPRHQKFRERVISYYRHNRIIQFPQSIHFQDSRCRESCREILSSHPDFHLLVRDHESLQLASRIHDGPTYLCPDMALCLGSLPRTASAQYPVLGLLRTDKEKAGSSLQSSSKNTFFYTDWLDEPQSVLKWAVGSMNRLRSKYPRWTGLLDMAKPSLFHLLANERLKRGCDILCSGEVVIPDRLHGHLMCCLLGIPHVVLDNTYGKIGNFRDAWGTGEGGCEAASSFEEAQEKALALLERFRDLKILNN